MNNEIIKGLQERRLRAWEAAKEIDLRAVEEGRDLTAEERSAWDNANSEIDNIDERVKALVDAEQRAADAAAAFDALNARATMPAVSADGDEFRRFIGGELRSMVVQFDKQEMRDLTKGTSSSGGATVPTSFSGMLWEHLVETATVAGVATVLNTASGENLEMPTTTSHSSGALISENSTVTESDPAFTKRTLGAYKYGVAIQVPSELLADTGVDLEGYLARQAGRAVGNAFGAHLVTGSGSSQPSGIVTGSSLGVTGAASVSGAFDADKLIDLFYSVIAPYRASAKAGWLMKDATLASVRKLKDSYGQYIWQPAYQIGAPDTILGKPVYTDPNVAAVALSAKSVIFGDMSAYHVRIAGGVRFERSDDFAFGTDQVTFRCLIRGDGVLLDQTGAVKHFIGNAA